MVLWRLVPGDLGAVHAASGGMALPPIVRGALSSHVGGQTGCRQGGQLGGSGAASCGVDEGVRL